MGQGQQDTAGGNAGQAAAVTATVLGQGIELACGIDLYYQGGKALHGHVADINLGLLHGSCCCVLLSAPESWLSWESHGQLSTVCCHACVCYLQHCAGHVRFQQRVNVTPEPDPRVGSAFTSYIAQSDLQQAMNKYRASNCSEAYYLLTGETDHACHHLRMWLPQPRLLVSGNMEQYNIRIHGNALLPPSLLGSQGAGVLCSVAELLTCS